MHADNYSPPRTYTVQSSPMLNTSIGILEHIVTTLALKWPVQSREEAHHCQVIFEVTFFVEYRIGCDLFLYGKSERIVCSRDPTASRTKNWIFLFLLKLERRDANITET